MKDKNSWAFVALGEALRVSFISVTNRTSYYITDYQVLSANFPITSVNYKMSYHTIGYKLLFATFFLQVLLIGHHVIPLPTRFHCLRQMLQISEAVFYPYAFFTLHSFLTFNQQSPFQGFPNSRQFNPRVCKARC